MPNQVTSRLPTFVGPGRWVQVHKMLPMTLGANIGTTFTALLAALAVPTHDSLQIAFCGAAVLRGKIYEHVEMIGNVHPDLGMACMAFWDLGWWNMVTKIWKMVGCMVITMKPGAQPRSHAGFRYTKGYPENRPFWAIFDGHIELAKLGDKQLDVWWFDH